MRLRCLFRALPAELARLSCSYAAQSRRHACLDAYPTLPLLLAHLKEPGLDEPRSELVASLLRIHEASPHAVWSAVLMQIFRPTVRGLRKELVGDHPEALDDILVETFFETLALVRTHDGKRIFMYVRQELRRRTFKRIAEAAAWRENGFGVGGDPEEDPARVAEPTLVGVWLEGHASSPEQAELLSTLLDRGGLDELVARRHPDLDALDRARV